jgi:hypothetical protein
LAPITRERAERIARAHPCEKCGEYSFKRLVVKPASPALEAELHAVWVASKICGVCGTPQELGIDEDGDIVYVSGRRDARRAMRDAPCAMRRTSGRLSRRRRPRFSA